MSIELKPCPFCGGEASLYGGTNFETARSAYYVECSDPLCPVCPTTPTADLIAYKTEAKAAEAWNTRAERTCVVEEVVKRERALGAPTWDYQLSCGHFAYEWPWKEAPAYCPDCGAKVVE